jgi:transcriptional regulator with XRE-family HTH domain
MPSHHPVPRTNLERGAARQAREIPARIGQQLRTAREDAGLSLAAVAAHGGLSKSRLHDIEAGTCQPRWETIWRVAAVLGQRLRVGIYPDSGPLIRDHIQAAMLAELVSLVGRRWRAQPEVPVYHPVRGVIDLVLEDVPNGTIVACEAQSELRRLEQQLRWSRMKADALASSRVGPEGQTARHVGRLLLLRSTTRTRAAVARYADLVATAYPVRAADAFAALAGSATWPGDALLWSRVEGDRASILDRPPRGITVGR